MLLTPRAERGPLVVDENSAILHCRPVVFVAVVVIQLILMYHRGIGHPVPRRHAYATRYLVDAKDGTTLIVASDDEISVNYIDDIALPMSLNLLHIKLLLLDEPIDKTALVDGTNHDGRGMW